MTLPTVGVGSSANDGTGDPLRTAFQSINGSIAALNAGEFSNDSNLVTNSAMQVAQRGDGPHAGTGYGIDMWTMISAGGATASVSRTAITAGAFADAPRYYAAITWTGTLSSSAIWGQRIEDVRNLAGRKARIKFWAKADSARTLKFTPVQNFGSGGSTAVFGSTLSFSVTTSWAQYSAVVDMASVSGKTIGTGSYIELRFFYDSGATNPGLDITDIEFGPGSANASYYPPFRRRGTVEELRRCRRYFQRFDIAQFASFIMAGYVGSNTYRAPLTFDPPMRANPSFTQSGTFEDQHFANDATTTSFVANTNQATLQFASVGSLTDAATAFRGADATNWFAYSAEL